ncbi:DUF1127 domain-containing protein [Bosea sp. (in: a-proteobacteria)]|uniref:DUF1127 domain-containing protein n=1 Tax=Bosea sp. (in: a-proteobacteria) TaxID=1871050 RepID=UPI002735B8ED|nr:DUF1127 domain-containing protein [Bosea sp. (in: a-proteobacteria)]MDP3256327.1 DUF1127 domain-containing protein [Bosea sp. (in: a-proteobacteria)]
MYAFRQESCTGCTGPGRQMCEVRPARRPLFSIPKTAAAPTPARPGDQTGIAACQPCGADEAGLPRPWPSKLRAAFAGFRERAAERRRNRQIALELSRLDDRTLRDIGISRPEIEAAIASAQRGRR